MCVSRLDSIIYRSISILLSLVVANTRSWFNEENYYFYSFCLFLICGSHSRRMTLVRLRHNVIISFMPLINLIPFSFSNLRFHKAERNHNVVVWDAAKDWHISHAHIWITMYSNPSISFRSLMSPGSSRRSMVRGVRNCDKQPVSLAWDISIYWYLLFPGECKCRAVAPYCLDSDSLCGNLEQVAGTPWGFWITVRCFGNVYNGQNM